MMMRLLVGQDAQRFAHLVPSLVVYSCARPCVFYVKKIIYLIDTLRSLFARCLSALLKRAVKRKENFEESKNLKERLQAYRKEASQTENLM
ncbi:hypothetical protein OSB04_016506 [Centaurea solstitialis]|uniref:Uncharacterized protein n=1 Tax=Centaurea solstitialis TaxID=347529 RepID=A0AA38TC55_9ASTR|nr:hypothetical protein OSB04_016506 [Centaurea solstitialis]